MTISSIGSGKTYPDPATWLAAWPGSGTGAWEGQCYNTGEFTSTSTLNFAGHATSASDSIKLTTAAGESFQDNANVQTNALRYNASNGVGIRKTSAYGAAIAVSENYVVISKLQIAHTGAGNNDQVFDFSSTGSTNCVVDSCIGECNNASSSGNPIWRQRSGGIVNSLIVNRGTAGSGITFDYVNGSYVVNCTIVRPQSPAGTALSAFGGGTWLVTNCAIFGFSTLNSGGTASGSNNASDLAIGFGSSNQASKTYSSQFQNITDATRDFRAKAGADINAPNGVDVSATYTGTTLASKLDIAKTNRGTSWSIGCWQIPSGGGGSYSLAANPGTYAITGAAAKLATGRKLAANSGSYLVSGVATRLAIARKLAANAGAYAITGAAAALKATRVLQANAGVYAITGFAAALIKNNGGSTYTLLANPGSYAITGAPARLSADRKLTANAGSYFVTGQAALLNVRHAYILQADPGSYFIVGYGALLTASGAGPSSTGEYLMFARRKLRR